MSEEDKNQKKHSFRRLLWEYFESLVIAIFIAVTLRAFVISAYKIPTASMAPTLQPGDFVFCFKLPYGIRIPFTESKLGAGKVPDRGEVIVFRFPMDDRVSFIKRVIGLPGDKIEIKNRKLWINDKPASYEDVENPEKLMLAGQQYYESVLEKYAEEDWVIMLKKNEAPESFGPTMVPPKHIFVLGDNRDTSDDSRNWGMVPLNKLEGRVWLTWLSLDWRGSQGIPAVRWQRLLKKVK
jgi:signal peptidase I